MKKGRNNKIHFFTTLSIYVGLVLVGGTPELLARSKVTENLRTPGFELSTRAEIVSSKLKLRKNVESRDILPLASTGGSVFQIPYLRHRVTYNEQFAVFSEVRFLNNQIFTPNLFARAHLS